MKRALVTGITGQDSAYPTEFLRKKGYEVYGSFEGRSDLNPDLNLSRAAIWE